jgi:selenium-binding protein 1
VYFTNSLYAKWDDVFYPDDVGAWMARLDANTETGGMSVDLRFFPHGDDFNGLRVHQARLQGGDASSDSYCLRRVSVPLFRATPTRDASHIRVAGVGRS